MKIHHINCGSMCPLSARLTMGEGPLFGRGDFVCHCLLIETDEGLVLVDSGIGTHDCHKPKSLGFVFNVACKPHYREEETALAQVKARGFRPEDVRHIVLTHLDVDHAGALADFPHAKVHVHATEHQRATHRSTREDKLRYFVHHFAHGVDWETYSEEGEAWFGMEAVRSLRGLPEEILLIPLFGHSAGHTAVAVQGEDGWWMHCGDGYFHRQQIDPDKPYCPPGLKLFQKIIEWDTPKRVANVRRLQQLKASHGDEVKIFCAHDVVEFRDAGGVSVG